MDRRRWLTLLLLATAQLEGLSRVQGGPDRPNILWITCEDISPNLGCYGDPYAVTPNLDRLARQGVRYDRAFATIGVCAPARSTIITGMYPPSIGTQHMRCEGVLPRGVREFPRYLRDAGYYCVNNVKTDYNFKHHPETWHESSPRAHWRRRAEDQPFFAVFNLTSTHESQIRLSEDEYKLRMLDVAPELRHDPARAEIPPYHPDVAETRRDWARYADMITLMDRQVASLLMQLEQDGLADSTIVFFYSDHGAGLPRSKRWLYDSSLRVPFIVRFPDRFSRWAPGPAGSSSDRLISFVDLAPTVLSLTGIAIPDEMQGKAFLGVSEAEPRSYVHGFRDRMDERYDMIRCVRDSRFKYIRNYMPQLPWFGGRQYISYMYEMPTMRRWQELADWGQLEGAAATFMKPTKPAEELYDTEADPWEIENLVGSQEHRATLERLRGALDDWEERILDLGFLPEPDLRTRFGKLSPYDAVRDDPGAYPLLRIREAARVASLAHDGDRATLVGWLDDPDPAVRWWAAMGIGSLGDLPEGAINHLEARLSDSATWVRVAAADSLLRLRVRREPAFEALAEAMADSNPWTRLQAINTLDGSGPSIGPAIPALRAAVTDENPYVIRVSEHAIEALDAREAP